MQGSITRGNVDTIAAVLWFCDLRVGFESHAARANLRTRSMTEAA